MQIHIRGYITHKEAEKYSDCADRYAVDTNNRRFAIADGVSKSFYPDYWAEILVNNYVSLQNAEDLSIEKCQSEWLEKVKLKINNPTVKWFTKNAFIKQEPGLATFVGLRIDNRKWNASALGDSFLFFIPESLPGFENWIKLSSKPEPIIFDSFPDYYSSRNNKHGDVVNIEKVLVPGTFYLMTDALAEWVYKAKEIGIKEINEKWKSQVEFVRSIKELRMLNVLNNDDSAILIIEVKDDGKDDLCYEKVEVMSLSELTEKEETGNIEDINIESKNLSEEMRVMISPQNIIIKEIFPKYNIKSKR